MATYSAPLIYKTIFNTLDYTTAATITNASDTIYTGKNTFTNNLILTKNEAADNLGSGSLQILGGISCSLSSFFGSTVSMFLPPIFTYTTPPTFVVGQLGHAITGTAITTAITTSITGLGTAIDVAGGISCKIGTYIVEITAEYTSNNASNVVAVENLSCSMRTGEITGATNQVLTQVSFGPNSLTRRIKHTQVITFVINQAIKPVLRLDYATTGGFTLGNSTFKARNIFYLVIF